MYCSTCKNLLDITNNAVLSVDVEKDADVDEDTGTELAIEDSSSDYNISSDVKSKRKKQTIITEEDIIKILEGTDIIENIDSFSISDVNKIPYFNKLTNNQKTLVINRFYERLPKHSKIPKTTINPTKTTAYFYCNNCGCSEKIPKKTFIFSRSSEKHEDKINNNNFINFKYDPTLHNTKKYICNNDKCSTHENPLTKMAVFFRTSSSYNMRYCCTVCDTFWTVSLQPDVLE